MPAVSAIWIHPIKAFDPVRVSEARLLPSGALELDRRWAFVNEHGEFVNGKNYAAVHGIRAEYDLGKLEVALDGIVHSLEHQRSELEAFVSERIGEPVFLRRNDELGFPDDTKASGPTFVSEPSLRTVVEWFPMPLELARRRFRTNVELDGCEPFWEDRLYGHSFTVGDVTVFATNACQRCIVPSRDPLTGLALPGFQREFTRLRRASLPSEAAPEYFDHCYRFAVNTRIGASEGGKRIRTGDAVAFPG